MIALLLLLDRVPDFAALSLLALLQGLTEFLPVSSSGHLVLTQAALGFEEPALVVDVALHLGTLLAVFIVYRRDLAVLARDAARGRRRELSLLVVASVPAAAVGIGARRALEGVYESPHLAAGGLFVTAVVLLAGEIARRRKRAGRAPVEERAGEGPGYGAALLIGVAQALAIWPGISRSGSTIAVGLLCGLSPQRAARFSFLLSIIAITGAALLQLPRVFAHGMGGGGGTLLWAVLFAGLVGWGSLRVLLAFVSRGAFAWFAVYCALLGTGALVFA